MTLIAYFGMPLISITISLGSSLGTLPSIPENVSASQLGSAGGMNGMLGMSAATFFWVLPVLTVCGLVAAATIPFTSLAARSAAHLAAGVCSQLGAGAAALIVVLGTLQTVDQLNTFMGALGGSLTGTSGSSLNFGLSYGFYTLLGGLAVILIGGILVLARRDRPARAAALTPTAA